MLYLGISEASTQNAEKAKAAQLKMFGRLTRETSEWVPARLLCVRFNVKNPFADDKADTGAKKKKPPSFDSAELFSKLDEPRRGGAPPAEGDEPAGGQKQLAVTLEKEEEEEVQEKPPMDLFKAIFANSDSESSEEEENDGDRG
jgi:G patch domain-containing protein 1